MTVVSTLVWIGTFPTARTAAISRRQKAEERTLGIVERVVVVMVPDGRPLGGTELEAQTLEDADATMTVTRAIPAGSLAEVMEESCDSNAVRWN